PYVGVHLICACALGRLSTDADRRWSAASSGHRAPWQCRIRGRGCGRPTAPVLGGRSASRSPGALIARPGSELLPDPGYFRPGGARRCCRNPYVGKPARAMAPLASVESGLDRRGRYVLMGRLALTGQSADVLPWRKRLAADSPQHHPDGRRFVDRSADRPTPWGGGQSPFFHRDSPKITCASEVARPQDSDVMQFMTGDDVSQRAYAGFVVIRGAAPQPRIPVQVFEQIDIRFARVFELFGQIGQRARAERGVGHVTVLVEAGERRRVVAGETQSSVSEDAFGVDQMADHLFDAPLTRSV